MVKRSKGSFSGSTRKLRGKGVVSVARVVRTFNVGDKVVITPKANWVGLPHMRYSGKQGVVVEKRGKSYVVEVRDYAQKKMIIAGPVHLTLAKLTLAKG